MILSLIIELKVKRSNACNLFHSHLSLKLSVHNYYIDNHFYTTLKGQRTSLYAILLIVHTSENKCDFITMSSRLFKPRVDITNQLRRSNVQRIIIARELISVGRLGAIAMGWELPDSIHIEKRLTLNTCKSL